MIGTTQDPELRALLAQGALDQAADDAAGDWADGYGIAAPDVARYASVLRPAPDAVLLAMRNLAIQDSLEVVDEDTATLVALLAQAQRPERVLEVGTGIGYLALRLARALPDDCTLTSVEADPILHGRAHAFLERDGVECATELRLGDPFRVLRDHVADAAWELVVLTDPALPRLELLDVIAPHLAADALVVVPWALRGGRVADGHRTWEDAPDVAEQRTLNRCIAIDPRFTDVVLLPVGDGLLLARRR